MGNLFQKFKLNTQIVFQYVKYLAALLSICCMIFLGFADDVLDIKWRHKLLMPMMASLPLLMVYFVSFDLTLIIVPVPVRWLFGYSVDIGVYFNLLFHQIFVYIYRVRTHRGKPGKHCNLIIRIPGYCLNIYIIFMMPLNYCYLIIIVMYVLLYF